MNHVILAAVHSTQLFPYHLSDYLCRIARITPFKYYLDMMATVLKDERSYDRVPNFTAADALSVLGIGRNEYIAALNACKARRLLWRVNINREGIVRENLPQGFVSNKTTDAGDAAADPLEALLYSVFVANSERTTVAELGAILGVPLPELQRGGSCVAHGLHGGVAVVVDAEATGYLMMGALSPGLKRHAVTLFEGGRVAGEEVIRELLQELWASCAASQSFEGEMLRLTHYAAALACLLEAVRASAGPGVPLELLRKESLAGLAPAAVYRVLTHAYCAVVPISPLPPPVLPLTPDQPSGTAYYGATLESGSPWLQLALYSAARCGPQSFVFVCGQRVWRLPHPLDRCSHALLTPWDEDVETSRAARLNSSEGQTTLVESAFLLHTLNDLLCRTAVLVQPLEAHNPDACPDVVDVPLPLPPPLAVGAAAPSQQHAASGAVVDSGSHKHASGSQPMVVAGVRRRTGESVPVVLECSLQTALRQLGLAPCVGYLRMLRMRAAGERDPHPSWCGHDTRGRQAHSQPLLWGDKDAGPGRGPAGGGTGGDAVRYSHSYSHGAAETHGSAMAGQRHGHHAYPSGGATEAGKPQPDGGESDAGGGGLTGDSAYDLQEYDSDNPWLPLSVHLGVPLHSLELCRAVCRAAGSAGFLSPEGRQTQLQAQQAMHSHLIKLVASYTHVASDGSLGSAAPLATSGPGAEPASASGDGGATAGEAASAWGWVTTDPGASAGSSASSVLTNSGGGGGGGSGAAGRILGSLLPLPALNLSFDGHSLQPIRLRDSVQGLGCVCQG
ncbi:hypothetical protein GPECTOR_39g479 [Gonium pectorale]|uniref:FAM91 N-terminal domain-containing protein n=1 Tax=Gonium pectorale TaxID=33097 RepID=A0A150GBQ8_GONPE|nr:hypothetical protein GPECTOR_39g479 [Gonium pectorale]|eukprot:KXZ46985.1 hypothetical protein GPECTOR_39g479 [Gonium pectorale]